MAQKKPERDAKEGAPPTAALESETGAASPRQTLSQRIAAAPLSQVAEQFIAALVFCREALQAIHARQVDGADGTSATAAFAAALLDANGGFIGNPPNPWPLKHLLDAPKYASSDPHANHATAALVAALFECLEEGRKQPNRSERQDTLVRVALNWAELKNWRDAAAFEDAWSKDEHHKREAFHKSEHEKRQAQAPIPRAKRVGAEPPEPLEPADLTVG